MESNALILAVVGSRDPFDPFSKEFDVGARILAHTAIKKVLLHLRPSKVISGGARGIDKLSVMVADSNDVRTEEFLPTIARWHDGFKPRNDAMAETCDALLRIGHTTTKTRGSVYTLERAISLGKSCMEITIDEEQNLTFRYWEAGLEVTQEKSIFG